LPWPDVSLSLLSPTVPRLVASTVRSLPQTCLVSFVPPSDSRGVAPLQPAVDLLAAAKVRRPTIVVESKRPRSGRPSAWVAHGPESPRGITRGGGLQRGCQPRRNGSLSSSVDLTPYPASDYVRRAVCGRRAEPWIQPLRTVKWDQPASRPLPVWQRFSRATDPEPRQRGSRGRCSTRSRSRCSTSPTARRLPAFSTTGNDPRFAL
jgi:hypothetical protein